MYSYKEDIHMTNKHMRRSLTSLVTRKTHIKTTMNSTLHLLGWKTVTSVEENAKKPENSYTASGIVKKCSHYGKVWQLAYVIMQIFHFL